MTNPTFLEFVGYNLRKEGYQVLTLQQWGRCGKGGQNAEKPQALRYLLDVMMPGMDGIETCDKLRSLPELEDTLIAFLTARGEDYSQVAGFDAGGG
ncbi:MAG: response regulator [Owenweeksia sp.]|nr:response regulator [Owenweeksia sp.]